MEWNTRDGVKRVKVKRDPKDKNELEGRVIKTRVNIVRKTEKKDCSYEMRRWTLHKRGRIHGEEGRYRR